MSRSDLDLSQEKVKFLAVASTIFDYPLLEGLGLSLVESVAMIKGFPCSVAQRKNHVQRGFSPDTDRLGRIGAASRVA